MSWGWRPSESAFWISRAAYSSTAVALGSLTMRSSSMGTMGAGGGADDRRAGGGTELGSLVR